MTNLKRLRLKSGLTQSQLAQITGLNLRTLQYYEQGINKIDQARLTTLLKIAIALTCKIKDLLEEQESITLCKKYENLN